MSKKKEKIARVHRVKFFCFVLFSFVLLDIILINCSAIQSTKLGNTPRVEDPGGRMMGAEGGFGDCSSLDAKSSFFVGTLVVIFVFCCIFSFKTS